MKKEADLVMKSKIRKTLWVVLALFFILLIFLPSGAGAEGGYTPVATWGSYGTGEGKFDRPYGIATDGAGNVYVADTYNHRIQKFSPDTTKPRVESVTLDPPSPVTVGEVTCTLVFSETMDTGISPTVTFGKVSPYTDRTVTQASYSADTWMGTFLISTGYDGEQHLSISGAKDLAGNPMDPDPDTSHTFFVDRSRYQPYLFRRYHLPWWCYFDQRRCCLH